MDDEQKRPRRPTPPGDRRTAAAPEGYFTVELAVVLLGLTALLVFLPLVLPPLPPPPFLLLLVPVGLLVLLLALAFFTPFDARGIGSSCL